MDPIQTAGLSVASLIAGYVLKWALERFLNRGDAAEKVAREAEAKAAAMAAAAAKAREEDILKKLGEVLSQVSSLTLTVARVGDQANAMTGRYEELKERINEGLRNHADRIRSLEDYRIQEETRHKLKG